MGQVERIALTLYTAMCGVDGKLLCGTGSSASLALYDALEGWKVNPGAGALSRKDGRPGLGRGWQVGHEWAQVGLS